MNGNYKCFIDYCKAIDFPSGLTWKDFIEGQGSIPHNPTIANVLYKSGMMERWGRGIQLIIDECIKQGLPEPKFETNPYFVNLTIWFRKPLEPRDANDVVKDVVKELSERQLFIIDLISNEPTLSAKAISERFSEKVGITPRTVQRDLAVLQKKGILAREGGRKDGRWVIVQPQ